MLYICITCKHCADGQGRTPEALIPQLLQRLLSSLSNECGQLLQTRMSNRRHAFQVTCMCRSHSATTPCTTCVHTRAAYTTTSHLCWRTCLQEKKTMCHSVSSCAAEAGAAPAAAQAAPAVDCSSHCSTHATATAACSSYCRGHSELGSMVGIPGSMAAAGAAAGSTRGGSANAPHSRLRLYI